MNGLCTGAFVNKLLQFWPIGAHSKVIFGISAVVIFGVAVNILTDVKIIAEAAAAAEALTGDVWSSTRVGRLGTEAKVNTNPSAAVMTT